MRQKKGKSSSRLLLLVIVLVIVAAALLAIVVTMADRSDSGGAGSLVPVNEVYGTEGEAMEEPVEEPVEELGVPLSINGIVLSYPAEIEDMVTITYEEKEDGQTVIFTTDFTGEELEMFRFTIGKTATDGYQLGVLEDETAGSLTVCVNVPEYTEGNLKPSEYNQLTSLQERVNDIIIQIHEDPRFVPNR